jgi:hypothetical protein
MHALVDILEFKSNGKKNLSFKRSVVVTLQDELKINSFSMMLCSHIHAVDIQ